MWYGSVLYVVGCGEYIGSYGVRVEGRVLCVVVFRYFEM